MKNKFILNILAIILLFSACKKDFLNRSPLDAYTNSNLWTSASDANSALVGVYNNWITADFVVGSDCTTDNGFNQYPWEGLLVYGNGTVNPSLVGPLSYPTTKAYNLYDYATITKCNFFLANIDKTPMDAVQKANMIAQVRVIRAYKYSVMSQLYGDVPLITTVLTPDESLASVNAPKAAIVKFIISELAAAAADLSVTPNSGDGHITKGAALALKARIELYNGNYADCITDCQAVMKMGYTLYPSYTDLFRIKAQNANAEVILSAQFVQSTYSNNMPGKMASNSSGGYSSFIPVQSLVDVYEMANGKPITDPSSGFDAANPYANRDPRLAATIMYPGASFTQVNGTLTYYDPFTTTSADYYASRNNTSPAAYLIKKYNSNLTDFSQLFNVGLNIPIMRYAEVLLTDAEAKIEMSKIDGTVYDDISAVRVRAGMPPVDRGAYGSQTALRALVRNERRIELAFEGLRFFDIQRWKIGSQVMSGAIYGAKLGTINPANGKYTITGAPLNLETRVFSDKNYLWPIPQSEIDLDKNLKQNPGY
ncbi:RagB/SusD family nutrient uptake outer membrane protein [Agrobacterium tumefaciens]|nr:RagB/SusD family nutrient uptake outer membrane protein [Agrobacterium tumefaciens]NTE22915.1 RagB/SusD family nutrient uptake outer membrane protein [Agrobacterium tumefaciens]